MGTYSRRLRWLPAVFLLLLLPLLTSCTPEEGDPHRFEVTEQEGVEIATTRGGPKYVGELFDYHEIRRLRPDSSRTDSYLIDPDPPVIGPDGNHFVLDRMGDRIAVFGPEGRFLGSIGQPGEGPGDLVRPRYLLVADGRIQVNSHFANWRLSRFTPGGELVDVTTQSMATDSIVPKLIRAPSGRLLVQLYHHPRSEGTEWQFGRLSVLETDGDTVGVVETPRIPYASLTDISWEDRATEYGVRIPYNGFAFIDYQPGVGIYESTGLDPEIRFHDLEGRLERRIRIEMQAPGLSDADRDAHLDRLREELREARSRPDPNAYTIARLEAEISRTTFPEHRAFWRNVQVDDGGWIWLSVVETPSSMPQFERGARWRVLDPRGEYLGETSWPPLADAHISRGHLAGIWEDPESGEQVPVICGIRPALKGIVYP